MCSSYASFFFGLGFQCSSFLQLRVVLTQNQSDVVKLILHILVEGVIHFLQAQYMTEHKLVYVFSLCMLICFSVVLGYLKLAQQVSWRSLLHIKWFDLTQA